MVCLFADSSDLFFILCFFGISLVTPLCTLHPSAPLALNSFFFLFTSLFHNFLISICVWFALYYLRFFFIQRDKIQIQMHALLHINIFFSVVTCYIWSRLKIKKMLDVICVYTFFFLSLNSFHLGLLKFDLKFQ